MKPTLELWNYTVDLCKKVALPFRNKSKPVIFTYFPKILAYFQGQLIFKDGLFQRSAYFLDFTLVLTLHSIQAVTEVISLGLQTTVHPDINAGPSIEGKNFKFLTAKLPVPK